MRLYTLPRLEANDTEFTLSIMFVDVVLKIVGGLPATHPLSFRASAPNEVGQTPKILGTPGRILA